MNADLDKLIDSALDEFSAPIEPSASTTVQVPIADKNTSISSSRIDPRSNDLTIAAPSNGALGGATEEEQKASAQDDSSVDFALQMLAKGAKEVQQAASGQGQSQPGFPGLPPGFGDLPGLDAEGAAELAKMMSQLMGPNAGGDGAGGGDQVSSMNLMMEKMMEDMLSKEFLYEPVKDLVTKYPSWLAENKGNVANQEYQRYEKQFECFKSVLEEFDKPNGGDRARINALMAQVQEYGSPPQDLLANANGLEDLLGAADNSGANAVSLPATGAMSQPSDAELKEMAKAMEAMAKAGQGSGCPQQ